MQKKIIIGAAIALGLITMFVSYTMINKHVNSIMTTTNVIVAKSDIGAYSVINQDNLETRAIPTSIVNKSTVVNPSQIAGKSTSVPLYAGEPIDARNIIAAKENLEDKQVVGIYIDAARFAGVTNGDIVDVYRVSPINGNPSTCIALNSRVLKVTDEKGTAITSSVNVSAAIASSTGNAPDPRIVYILIKSEEVPLVIQGSVSQGQNYLALAKKSKETTPSVVATTNTETMGEGGQ